MEKENNKKPAYYKYIAAASVIIIVIVTIFYLFGSGEGEEILEDNQSPAIKDTIVFPDHSLKEDTTLVLGEGEAVPEIVNYNKLDFTENYSLENFINRSIRSDSSAQVISPAIGDTIKTHLHFEWNSIEDANEYNFEIVNNKNRLIWGITTDYNKLTYLEKLEPGLYYWKVQYKRKLYFVGKFFVK